MLDVSDGSRTYEFEDDEEDPRYSPRTTSSTPSGSAERHEEADHRSAAERAAADRTWAFGHIIVDEAQELSPMAWRLLMRRCPTRSMTLVGDPAQTADAAGCGVLGPGILAPYVGDRWEHARLGVNYRTPAEIMDVAAAVRAGRASPASSRRVRYGRPGCGRGCAPSRRPRGRAVAKAVGGTRPAEGRLAVIAPRDAAPRRWPRGWPE